MKKRKFTTGSREVTLFSADSEDRPLIVLNNYDDDGSAVMNAIRELGGADLNLLCISGLDWNHDLAPWPYTPDFGNEEAFTGGGDEYLALMLSEILPKAKEMISGTAPRTCIAGYSLAGLFALIPCTAVMPLTVRQACPDPCGFPGSKNMFTVKP